MRGSPDPHSTDRRSPELAGRVRASGDLRSAGSARSGDLRRAPILPPYGCQSAFLPIPEDSVGFSADTAIGLTLPMGVLTRTGILRGKSMIRRSCFFVLCMAVCVLAGSDSQSADVPAMTGRQLLLTGGCQKKVWDRCTTNIPALAATFREASAAAGRTRRMSIC